MQKVQAENPGTQAITPGCMITDFTGKGIDQLYIVGYHGKAGAKMTKNGNRKKTSRRHHWTVRCSCGMYFLRSHHDVSMDIKRPGRRAMCHKCYGEWRKYYGKEA